jgi:hypothetical protein
LPVEHEQVIAEVAGGHGGPGRREGRREGGYDELELGGPPPVNRRLAGARPLRDALDAQAVKAVLG